MRLVYLSPVPWASFSQRPHMFVEWFRKKYKGEVLWVEPYPARLPIPADFRRLLKNQDLVSGDAAPSWLTVLHPRSLPVEPLPGGGSINSIFWKKILNEIDTFISMNECVIVVGKPSELALRVLGRNLNTPSLYDAMDNFSAFFTGISRVSMEHRESEVAQRVSRISVSSTMLTGRFKRYSAKVAVALNACASEILPGVSLPLVKPMRPVLGYVGMINHWFDWQLVIALAEKNPSSCVRLIGPMHVLPPGSVPKNIEILPACNHSTAIKAMQEFTVGLIPFKKSSLTQYVDPIKYYEYRSLGMPIISTSFGEMSLRGELPGVFLVDSDAELDDAVKMALAWECNLEDVYVFREQNSWNARFDSCDMINVCASGSSQQS